MSERPFMQLYVSDFIGDTLQLSTEQIGAYMLLLMAMWNAEGSLPNDDAKLARVVRMSVKKWRGISDDLMGYFEADETTISHNRLTKELRKSESKSQSRASAGEKGGRAKALKNNKPPLANAVEKSKHLPETITREDVSLRSTSTAPGRSKNELDRLETSLRKAAGLENDPSPGLFSLAPVLSCIDSGADLEMDVLPTVRALANRARRPPKSWEYFAQAIMDAHADRSKGRTGQAARASPLRRTIQDVANEICEAPDDHNEREKSDYLRLASTVPGARHG